MTTRFTFKIAGRPEDIAAAQRIRKEIFVREQNIPAHLDNDGLDDSAHHVLCYCESKAVATGRLVLKKPNEGILARIAVLRQYRGYGLGRRIVEELEGIAVKMGVREVTLHPHSYLEKFYTELGYEKVAGISVVGEHELITMKKCLCTHEQTE